MNFWMSWSHYNALTSINVHTGSYPVCILAEGLHGLAVKVSASVTRSMGFITWLYHMRKLKIGCVVMTPPDAWGYGINARTGHLSGSRLYKWVRYYVWHKIWGQNSSVGNVLVSLSCLMQHCGFDPPVEGIFPLKLIWFLTPFPQNSFGWEYKLRSSLCTHAFHCTDKDPDIHVLDEWMLATKTHPACTIHEDGMWLPQWLDWNMVTYAKISPKMVNLRDIARENRRQRRHITSVSMWPHIKLSKHFCLWDFLCILLECSATEAQNNFSKGTYHS